MQGIALATRQPKDQAHSEINCRAAARARAAEHGFGAAELTALRTRTPGVAVDPEVELLHRRLSGPTGLTETHNTFARRHALAEIAGTCTAGASMRQLEHATDRYLSAASMVALGEVAPGDARFTTQSLLSSSG